MELILEKLFESVPKVRILRLFMRNPELNFTLDDITTRSQITPRTAKNELAKLIHIGLIEKRKITVKLTKPKRTKKILTYSVNPRFEFLFELRSLVTRAISAPKSKILKKIRGLGHVKLAVIAGTLTNKDGSRVDLLVVGDKIKRRKFDKFLTDMESELGKTLSYALMDSAEFKYRRNMYDRFLRDIFEFPHEKLINKLNV